MANKVYFFQVFQSWWSPVCGPLVILFSYFLGYFGNNDLSDLALNSLQNSFMRSAAVANSSQGTGTRHAHTNTNIGAIGSSHFTDPAIYSAGPLYIPSTFFPQGYPGINVRPFVAPSESLFPFIKVPDSTTAAAHAAAYRQGTAAGVTGLATALPFLSQVW